MGYRCGQRPRGEVPPRRLAVLEVLEAATSPLTLRDLADLLAVSPRSVRHEVEALAKAGRVGRVTDVYPPAYFLL